MTRQGCKKYTLFETKMTRNDTLFMTATAKKSHTFWAEYTQNSALRQYLSNAI